MFASYPNNKNALTSKSKRDFFGKRDFILPQFNNTIKKYFKAPCLACRTYQHKTQPQ